MLLLVRPLQLGTFKSERPSCPRSLYLCSSIPFRATNPPENRAANPINSCHSQTKTGQPAWGRAGGDGARREGTVRGLPPRLLGPAGVGHRGRGGGRLGVSPTSTPPPAFVRALPLPSVPCSTPVTPVLVSVLRDAIQAPPHVGRLDNSHPGSTPTWHGAWHQKWTHRWTDGWTNGWING